MTAVLPIYNADGESWRDDALCAQVDIELFFPEKGGTSKDAKGICRQCPVQAECLEDALRWDERFGIRAGLSVRERLALQRKRGGVS